MKRRKIRKNLTMINVVLFLTILTLQVWKAEKKEKDEISSQVAVVEEEQEAIKPKIALTFDDGPHPVYTPMLLEGLRERRVTATFFLIGENIEGNEEIVKQMSDQGHLIGNHTYHHVKVDELPAQEACEEMVMTSDLVKEITGETTCYIRPPFGSWDKSLDCGIDMISVMWTIDPLDWTTKNVSQVVNKVVTEAKENDIILLHDCYESSVQAAFQIIDQLQARGFEFVTVDELILE
ncbi:MAG: polysaccharide deacetylase family protein [Lachnospiraceae bacterium]|nr:polysaccharide deacetylase family protein [Robinsoniella sp.]MDY3765511.1 polysaccharide deacetylase family protein [Lachnospiraceae bacterium]